MAHRTKQLTSISWRSLTHTRPTLDEADTWPDQLSGGMARRLALARCAALGGDLLLLDEPFTGVDGPRRTRLLERLRALGTPVLLISHEQEVLDACDAVLTFAGPPLTLQAKDSR